MMMSLQPSVRFGFAPLLVACTAMMASFTVQATTVLAYANAFDGTEQFLSGVTGAFSGPGSIQSVGLYEGAGAGGSTFSGSFLRNTSNTQPPSATVLTLSGLPVHTSIDINFLLAVIDTWDGNDGNPNAPDRFNVLVDGASVFAQTIHGNIDGSNGSYNPSPEVAIPRENRGFGRPSGDSGLNLGRDPIFDGIAHSASTLTIEWFADGAGWQGGDDESWALDNVSILLNGTVPVPAPSVALLLATGTVMLAGAKRESGVVNRRFASPDGHRPPGS